MHIPPILLVTIIAFSLIGCASPRSTRPDELLSSKTFKTGISFESISIENFARATQKCAAENFKDSCAVGFWETGKTVLEITCQKYLDKLSLVSQGQDFYRKETSLIGGFIAGGLGLAKSPVSHVSGLALLTALVTSSQDNFSESYLFSPGSHQLASIVSKAQQTYLSAWSETIESESYSYSTAIDVLLGYEDVCRPSTIRRLIDEAVANTEIKASIIENSIAEKDTGTLLSQLYAITGQPLDEANATRLFAWFGNLISNQTKALENTKALRELKLLKSDSDPATQDMYDKSFRKEISLVFAPLLLESNGVRKRWTSYIANLSAAGEKEKKSIVTVKGKTGKVTLTAR
jgi:hypothetical protein